LTTIEIFLTIVNAFSIVVNAHIIKTRPRDPLAHAHTQRILLNIQIRGGYVYGCCVLITLKASLVRTQSMAVCIMFCLARFFIFFISQDVDLETKSAPVL
jgi:hypothetical protein